MISLAVFSFGLTAELRRSAARDGSESFTGKPRPECRLSSPVRNMKRRRRVGFLRQCFNGSRARVGQVPFARRLTVVDITLRRRGPAPRPAAAVATTADSARARVSAADHHFHRYRQRPENDETRLQLKVSPRAHPERCIVNCSCMINRSFRLRGLARPFQIVTFRPRSKQKRRASVRSQTGWQSKGLAMPPQWFALSSCRAILTTGRLARTISSACYRSSIDPLPDQSRRHVS